jgi:hypothetical protein
MDVDVELDIQFTEAMPAVVSGKGSSGHTSIVATCSKITGIKGRTQIAVKRPFAYTLIQLLV